MTPLTQNEKRLYLTYCLERIALSRDGEAFAACDLPDCFTSLEACHQAEKVLTKEQKYLRHGYADKLEKICGGQSLAYFATAAQRAECLGRALGLWEEGE